MGCLGIRIARLLLVGRQVIARGKLGLARGRTGGGDPLTSLVEYTSYIPAFVTPAHSSALRLDVVCLPTRRRQA